MPPVRKAIFPAAGLGTRFLPVTKAQPKEMLPLVDKPTIQYGVEEAIASGIEQVIMVTGGGKRAIECVARTTRIDRLDLGRGNASDAVGGVELRGRFRALRPRGPVALDEFSRYALCRIIRHDCWPMFQAGEGADRWLGN